MCSSLSSVQVRGGNGTLNKCNALRYDLVGSNFRGHLGDLRQHVPLAADAILRFQSEVRDSQSGCRAMGNEQQLVLSGPKFC